jgi:hypothetical protein
MTMNINELVRGGTVCLSKAGLAIGSTATGISIAAPNGAGVDFAINGVAYHKADAATAALTVHDAQSADTKCIYLVCLDSSGTVSSVQGTEVTSAALTAGTDVLEFPTPVADTCPIGYFTMTTVAVTFTTGTDNLTASGCTAAYVDLLALPAAPLTS